MGQYTHFYGKLEFTRPLNAMQRSALEWMTVAPRLISKPIRERYWEEFEKSGRQWDNERDNDNMHKAEEDEGFRRAGFVTTDGLGFGRDMRVVEDGLVYASEKSYDLVSGINFIIENARQIFPDFGLKGQLYAQTEFEPHEWLLKINDQGWAEQVPCDFRTLPPEEQEIIADGQKALQAMWESSSREMREQEEKEAAERKQRYGFLLPMKEVCDRAWSEFDGFLYRCGLRVQDWVKEKLHL